MKAQKSGWIWPRLLLIGTITKLSPFKFALGSLVIPLAIRGIPELIAGPYPIGYDTIAAYVPGMLDIRMGNYETLNLKIGGWLLYGILALIYISTHIDAVLIVKFAGPLLYGLLGVSEFLFARRSLGWTERRSFELVLVASVYFVLLRISWDLLRNTLGLSLLLLAITALGYVGSSRGAFVFSALSLLTVTAHLLTASILTGLVLINVLSSNKQRNRKVICFIPALGFYILLAESSPTFEAVAQYAYPVYIFLPLIPLALLGVRMRPRHPLGHWLLICGAGVALGATPFAISSQIVVPYRWSLMMAFPLVVLAMVGKSRLVKVGGKVSTLRRTAWLGWLLMILILGATYAALPDQNAFPYFRFFSPTSMLQSTIPLEDSASLVHAIDWLSAHIPPGGVLMTHHAIYGWVREYFHGNNTILYFPPGTSLNASLRQTLDRGFTQVYTIWWVAGYEWYGDSVPGSFTVQHVEGRMAAYFYNAG
ncbi:hypothetical protein E6H29_11085 [Candidatus Bathyarchaeota archaeon]|nr:MAG: hypothetical protein E6H29_11085 [Candidatus Bathyarchaeota archaeon]